MWIPEFEANLIYGYQAFVERTKYENTESQGQKETLSLALAFLFPVCPLTPSLPFPPPSHLQVLMASLYFSTRSLSASTTLLTPLSMP